jgi:hypothetical protein
MHFLRWVAYSALESSVAFPPCFTIAAKHEWHRSDPKHATQKEDKDWQIWELHVYCWRYPAAFSSDPGAATRLRMFRET